HLRRRRVRLGREDMRAIAEARGSHRGHPPELPPAEDADRAARRQHQRDSGLSATASVCDRRQLSSAVAIAGSASARIPAANKAALTAPARPIAKVATGTPAGICTIDRRLSTPRNVRLSTGTPSTGRAVKAAAIPGKWAAPPAPAMISLSPRFCAFLA